MLMEQIFRGNFAPLDLVLPADPDYRKTNQKIEALTGQLVQKLEPADREQLNELIGLIYSAQCMESEALFSFGFAAGIRLQQKVQQQMNVLE